LIQQKRVLDTIENVNQGTSDLIETNGRLLKEQGATIQKRASGAMIDFEKLTNAINDTVSAIEDVENFKQKALPDMAKSIAQLQNLSNYVDSKVQKLEKSERVKISA
jgi:uncharacterized protein YaaN involved in tellurite resistance